LPVCIYAWGRFILVLATTQNTSTANCNSNTLTLLLTNVRSDVPQCFISISNYNSKFVLASNEKLINLFEGLEICRVNVVVVVVNNRYRNKKQSFVIYTVLSSIMWDGI
jgi:hypothetical protein